MNNSKFAQWWENNPDKADRIKARRRKKYADDPDYAEKERQRKREAYAKKHQKEKRRFPKPRLLWHEEKMIELWSVGQMAEFLGIHKRTISALEKRKAIPINRTADDNGRRWWPSAYVRWLKPYFDKRQSGKLSAQEFSDRVWNDWKNELQRGSLPVLSEESNDE